MITGPLGDVWVSISKHYIYRFWLALETHQNIEL